MISSSRLAELQHVPPAWKFCAAQAKSVSIAKMLREPTAGSGKPRRGHEKHCPAARIEATKKNKRGRNQAGATRKDREEVEVLRGSLHGVARALQAAQLHLQLQEAVLLPGCADGGHVLRPTRGSSSPRRCPRRSRTRPSIRTWIRAAKQI